MNRTKYIYGISSAIVFTLLGFGMSCSYFPNLPLYVHVAVGAGVGAIYTLIHRFMGTGNMEGAVFMVVLLIFLGVLENAVQDFRHQNRSPVSGPVSDK